MFFLGVDPGMNGAAVLITHAQQVVSVCKFKGATEKEICLWFDGATRHSRKPDDEWEITTKAGIELEHAMPINGKVANFKLGQSYGFLRGLLIAHEIPFEAIAPSKWQRNLGCISKKKCTYEEKKKITRAKAQELFPHDEWTNATADAALLAEFCRRTHG